MEVDLYKIAKRAKELADMPMRELRIYAGGFGADNETQALEQVKGKSRGECIEIALTEEFDDDLERR